MPASNSGLIQLSDLESLTRKLADLENATTRFPQLEVWGYINQGIRYVYRQMITVQDQHFYQKDWKFQTNGTGSIPVPVQTPTSYPLPPDFLQLSSVLWATNGAGPWGRLEPITESEYHLLLNAGYYGGLWPSGYIISGGDGAMTQGTIPTAMSLQILPQAPASSWVWVRYIPKPPLLQNATDTLDGIIGFEDAVVTWAAILMRRKDDLDTTDLERDMARHITEIRMIAKRRDRSQPPKIQIVRGTPGKRSRRGFGYPWR